MVRFCALRFFVPFLSSFSASLSLFILSSPRPLPGAATPRQVSPQEFWAAQQLLLRHAVADDKQRARGKNATRRWLASVSNRLLAAAPGVGEPFFVLGELQLVFGYFFIVLRFLFFVFFFFFFYFFFMSVF